MEPKDRLDDDVTWQGTWERVGQARGRQVQPWLAMNPGQQRPEWDLCTGDSASRYLLGDCVSRASWGQTIALVSASCIRVNPWMESSGQVCVFGGDTLMGRREGILEEWHQSTTLDSDLCLCVVLAVSLALPKGSLDASHLGRWMNE